MSNVFFTSDTHYGHKNIIEYSNRPFTDVEDMNESLIENWNSVVKPGDRVYHLGDFSWCDPKPIFDRLNGQKYLILGNHDDLKQHEKCGWTWIKNAFDLKHDGETIILYHYGQRVWNKMHYNSWMLYGHSHGKLPPYGKSFDVGVDCWNYFPISFEQVRETMSKQEIIKGFGD
jgi:calcineurin-like phosphoesterase family protein